MLEEEQHKSNRAELGDTALDFIGKEVGDVLEPIPATHKVATSGSLLV
jgi:hypothetical protein